MRWLEYRRKIDGYLIEAPNNRLYYSRARINLTGAMTMYNNLEWHQKLAKMVAIDREAVRKAIGTDDYKTMFRTFFEKSEDFNHLRLGALRVLTIKSIELGLYECPPNIDPPSLVTRLYLWIKIPLTDSSGQIAFYTTDASGLIGEKYSIDWKDGVLSHIEEYFPGVVKRTYTNLSDKEHYVDLGDFAITEYTLDPSHF